MNMAMARRKSVAAALTFVLTLVLVGAAAAKSRSPGIVSIESRGPTIIEIVFNKALDPATAEVSGHYFIQDASGARASLEVVKAVLIHGNVVQLTTAPQASAALYEMSVSGVTDHAGNAVRPNASGHSFVGFRAI